LIHPVTAKEQVVVQPFQNRQKGLKLITIGDSPKAKIYLVTHYEKLLQSHQLQANLKELAVEKE
jgi:hypothetical protein